MDLIAVADAALRRELSKSCTNQGNNKRKAQSPSPSKKRPPTHSLSQLCPLWELPPHPTRSAGHLHATLCPLLALNSLPRLPLAFPHSLPSILCSVIGFANNLPHPSSPHPSIGRRPDPHSAQRRRRSFLPWVSLLTRGGKPTPGRTSLLARVGSPH